MSACTNCPAEQGPLCAECEALRHACRAAVGESPRRQTVGLEAHRAWMRAVADLGDPARAAERLRAMLEVRGLEEVIARPDNLTAVSRLVWDWGFGAVGGTVRFQSAPALILALLAIPRQAPDARERTIAALEAAP